VTPKEMPEFGRVSQVDASAFDPGTAYIAVKKPLLNDLSPYIFRTRDFGKSWTKIVSGIGALDYVHVVREDRKRKGLLYAGTQHGFYVSYNDGDTWQRMSLNLPDVQISDIWVEDNAIAISTMGRSFYVLDDLNTLRYAPEAQTTATAYLFAPPDAIRGAGGVTIAYMLKKPAQKVTVEVVDASGTVAFRVEGPPPAGRGRGEGEEGEGRGGGRGRGGAPAAPVAAGLNRVTWGLDYPGATTFPGMILWGASTNGPAAIPGKYELRLTVDGQSLTQPLVVRRHPLRSATDADLKEQFDLGIRIRDKVSEANRAVIRIREIKQQVAEALKTSNDAQLKAAGDRLVANLTPIEEAIYQVRNQSGQDPLNFPIKINNRLASLLRALNSGDGKPIANIPVIFNDLIAELKVQTDRLDRVLKMDLPAFEALAKGEPQAVGGQAKIGKLVLAGPLLDGGTRRGLIAYRVATMEEAVERASGDPMIKVGRLKPQLYEWTVPKGILK
jgi:hypothetical protein